MVVDCTNQQSAVTQAEMVPFQVSYSGTLDLHTNKQVTLPQSNCLNTDVLPTDMKDALMCISK